MESSDMILAREIAQKVSLLGGKAYFVGGFVRDKLLGVENKDIDIEVHGIKKEQLCDILDSVGTRLEYGASFGIYSLKHTNIDVALPRTEIKTGNRHTDFDVTVDAFCGTYNAGIRRDFTINALMMDVLDEEIIDHFGGLEDLKNRTIRHINDEFFIQDPLRVLRCAQFAARFDFTVNDDTLMLCSKMDLTHISPERVFSELEKALLKADKPSVFFKTLKSMGKLDEWFPEIKALCGVEQNPEYHAEGDVFEHTMLTLDVAASVRDKAQFPLMFMISALVHDFGKAVSTEVIDGKIHSYMHEIAGLDIIRKFICRISSHKQLLEYALNMTKLHMRPNVAARRNSSIKVTNKIFDESVCPSDLILLSIADDKGRITEISQPETYEYLNSRLEIYQDYMSRPFVSGKDLISAGLVPDTSFSEILAYAHKLRLSGVDKNNALKQTLSFAKQLHK